MAFALPCFAVGPEQYCAERKLLPTRADCVVGASFWNAWVLSRRDVVTRVGRSALRRATRPEGRREAQRPRPYRRHGAEYDRALNRPHAFCRVARQSKAQSRNETRPEGRLSLNGVDAQSFGAANGVSRTRSKTKSRSSWQTSAGCRRTSRPSRRAVWAPRADEAFQRFMQRCLAP